MLPFNTPPSSWTRDGLETLCRERFPENQRVDYKRTLRLEIPENQFELLKDITSLANSSGGVIIYGIREDKDPALGSVAAELTPLTEPGLLDRANRIINARVQPNCQFFIYQIPADDGYFLVAYVPQSWQRPHAFQIMNRLEWYTRRNADNIPMTEPELRAMYHANASLQQTLQQRYLNLDLDIGASTRISLTAMPIVEGLRLLDPLARLSQTLATSYYIQLMEGANLQPRVDRYEEIQRHSKASKGMRLFVDGTLAFVIGFTQSNTKVEAYILYEMITNVLRYYSEVYKRTEYYGQLRLWFEVKSAGLDVKTSFMQGPFEDIHGLNRTAMLVPIDVSVDELSAPVAIASKVIRYWAQACDYDLHDRVISAYESSIQGGC